MAGYPGTIASTWQRAGRAGRRQTCSAAVLVASSAPLDQFIIEHPDYFFGQSPEHAHINPDNLEILLAHLKCAAFELPLAEGEKFGPHDPTELCRFLEEPVSCTARPGLALDFGKLSRRCRQFAGRDQRQLCGGRHHRGACRDRRSSIPAALTALHEKPSTSTRRVNTTSSVSITRSGKPTYAKLSAITSPMPSTTRRSRR